MGQEEGARTSAKSSAELTALCWSGRLSRFFTEPFLHNSMIPSLEPVETVESVLEKKKVTSAAGLLQCQRQQPTAPKCPVTAGDGLQVLAGEAKVALHLCSVTIKKKTNILMQTRRHIVAQQQEQNNEYNQSKGKLSHRRLTCSVATSQTMMLPSALQEYATFWLIGQSTPVRFTFF